MVTVLVIDDEITIRMLFECMLKENGYNVYTAEDGNKALEFLNNHKIDFMIIDIIMPEMSGWEFIQNLKKLAVKKPEIKNIPYIVITGENFLSKYKDFAFEKDKNFKGYFEKMTPVEKIIEIVKKNV